MITCECASEERSFIVSRIIFQGVEVGLGGSARHSSYSVASDASFLIRCSDGKKFFADRSIFMVGDEGDYFQV